MATVGTVLAKNMKIFVGTTAVSCQTNASVSMSTETFDTTCKDSSSIAEVLPGTRSWSASGEGNLAFDATNGWEILFDAWKNATLLNIIWSTGVTGDKKLSGTGYLTKLDESSQGNDAAVTFTFDITGTGDLTKATI